MRNECSNAPQVMLSGTNSTTAIIGPPFKNLGCSKLLCKGED